jgi:hypothetical protein
LVGCISKKLVENRKDKEKRKKISKNLTKLWKCMLSNYYWIIYVRMCLVNDGNGDDEKNEGRKKSIK